MDHEEDKVSVIEVSPGIHVLSNASLDSPWPKDEKYWPLMPSYGYGRECPGPRYGSLIHGQNLKDVIITGNNRDKWKKCIGDKDGESGLQVNKIQLQTYLLLPNVIAETHDTT
ncbi:hypothetical protein ACSBR2_011845 [Camellia fascicularis]